MENILLVINIIIAFLLIIVILLQRSEGGALGLGVSQDNFTSSRSAGDFLTKFTSILAVFFIVTSVALVSISRFEIREVQSVIDIEEEKKQKSPVVLYGGSVDGKNVGQFKKLNEIDGFLIGGASKADQNFIDIIKNYYR